MYQLKPRTKVFANMQIIMNISKALFSVSLIAFPRIGENFEASNLIFGVEFMAMRCTVIQAC